MSSPDLHALPANDLARLCSDGASVEAWHHFVERFQKPIALAIVRTCRQWGSASPALVDDLVQETFLRLCANECKLLKGFVAREPESLTAYLKSIAINATHDHFRAENAKKRGGAFYRVENERGDLDFLASSSAVWNAAEKSIQLAEIDRALRSCVPAILTERDRAIFWLYFEQGFSARDIAAIPAMGLTVKGVESSIHRSTKQLRQMLAPPVPAAQLKGFPGVSTILKESR